MSDQTRREAGEDFRIGRLLQPAFLQVIIVVETDAQNFGRYGHRRQQSDSVQVDCRRLPEASAGAQQVCALCDQLGQSAWKSPVAMREAMPARTFIRGNSGDSTFLEMSDSHESPAVRGSERHGSDEASVLVSLEWWHPPNGLSATSDEPGGRSAGLPLSRDKDDGVERVQRRPVMPAPQSPGAPERDARTPGASCPSRAAVRASPPDGSPPR